MAVEPRRKSSIATPGQDAVEQRRRLLAFEQDELFLRQIPDVDVPVYDAPRFRENSDQRHVKQQTGNVGGMSAADLTSEPHLQFTFRKGF